MAKTTADTQDAYIKFLEVYLERVKRGDVIVTQVTLDNNEQVELMADVEKRVTVSILQIRSVNRT